ncbi:MAG: DUF3592 domain-containing protein [Verrucomicrobiales bacterium]|nr:DUF3592 domain-containing protein [Verrucomicrobiales bacterium]
MPMTENEKDPSGKTSGSRGSALKHYSLAVFFVLMGIMLLATKEDFVTGMRSYFWKQAQGRIVSSDLISYTNIGSGKVEYELEIDGRMISKTARVFKEWSWGRRVRYTSWAKQYAKGERVSIFYNGSGNYSLGHWPTDAFSQAFLGLLYVTLGLAQWVKEFVKRKMIRRVEQNKS